MESTIDLVGNWRTPHLRRPSSFGLERGPQRAREYQRRPWDISRRTAHWESGSRCPRFIEQERPDGEPVRPDRRARLVRTVHGACRRLHERATEQ